jgi:hypothetical protein
MNGTADAIKQAMTRELDLRRAAIDGASDIGEVTITVKLSAGTAWIRGVRYQEERVFASRRSS